MGEREKDPPRRLNTRATPWTTTTADRARAADGEPPAYIKRAAGLERRMELFFAHAGKRHAAFMRFVDLRRREWEAVRDEPRREKRARTVLEQTTERCNARWRRWVETKADFSRLNDEIEAFNRHYPVERLAALKYVPLNQVTFEKRPPIGPADLFERFPFATAAF